MVFKKKVFIDEPKPTYIDVNKIAKIMGIGRTKVYELIDNGVFAAFDPLRAIRSPQSKKSKMVVIEKDVYDYMAKSRIHTTNINDI